MNSRRLLVSSILTFVVLMLSACASNIAIYEPPTTGALSNITFINSVENQAASFETFDDGVACVARRQIRFGKDDGVPAGASRSLIVSAGSEFALFVSLDRIESDDYEIEIGMTGGGPAPLRRRTVTAIGCTAQLSFLPEPDKNYRVEIAEPLSNDSCSVAVSEINAEGESRTVATNTRTPRSPRDEMGPFCEPLGR